MGGEVGRSASCGIGFLKGEKMILEEGMVLNRQQLAEWFLITPKTFSLTKDKKLEELEDYCQYEVELTPKGNFKTVKITQVFCGVYLKAEGKKLLEWLESGDRWLETSDQGVSSCAIVTNYYCQTHGIEYDGPHYIWEEVKGRSENCKERVEQNKKKPNPAFQIWHYLYSKVNRYFNGLNNKVDSCVYDLSAGEWNPTKAFLSTKEQIILRDQIAKKYYGEGIFDDAMELVDYLTESGAPSVTVTYDELKEFKLIAKMTDRQKRQAIAQEQVAAGVLKREGIKRRVL